MTTSLKQTDPGVLNKHLDLPLEIFGQNDVLSIMTPFVFIFPSPDPNLDISKLADSLQNGLVRLTTSFPWLAGRITKEVQTKVFKITSHRSLTNLVVKDLRFDSNAPTMKSLVDYEIPCSMLKEELFAPITVLPKEKEEDRSPLFHVQLSIITGGVVLSIMGNHQAMDGTGQDQISFLLDKACNGIPLTAEEIRIGNLCRDTIMEFFDDDWQPPVNSMYLAKPPTKPEENSPKEKTSPNSSEKVNHQWVEIIFSPSSQSSLKSTISRDLPTGSGFISTDDALTALIWQSLARVRLARLPPSTQTTIGRAVNPRRYLNIPPTYPGYISNNAYSTYTLHDLNSSSLSSIALELRAKVDPEKSGLGDSTREFATMLHRATDKNSISMNGPLDLDRDLMLSSWANMRAYNFDFGLGLGKPSYFRRTDQSNVPSLAFWLPKRPNGETVLSICLRADDLAMLQTDSTFTSYGRFILGPNGS